MKMKKRYKKAVSPVVATVLLIAIVVVLALIIFLWFRGFLGETIVKFGDKNIEQSCNDVFLEVSYSSDTLFVSNNGNVPVYSLNVKIAWPGGHQIRNIDEISGRWPESGLMEGSSFSSSIRDVTEDLTEITLIPILRGTTKDGEEKNYECDEKHGINIHIS